MVIDDGFTSDQRLGDIAADVLARLERLRTEFFHTGAALALLAQRVDDPALVEAAEAARLLAGRDLVERVRDAAVGLPLRGLEYGLSDGR